MDEKCIWTFRSIKYSVLVVLVGLMFFMQIIILPIMANITPNPVMIINTDQGIYYAVDSDGNTNIHVTGTLNGVSADLFNFQLELPPEFEMPMQSDNSPVLELSFNGKSYEVAQLGKDFDVRFILKTYNTTILPKSYLVKINSTLYQYSGIIKPKWPQIDSGGIGAAITSGGYPYIQNFYAYNSNKGEAEHVKTWIYNPSDYLKYLNYLQYKLRTYDYDDWEGWTPTYNKNMYIPDQSTIIVHDYLSPIFTATSNKEYAMNRGDYTVTQVYAHGSGWGDYDYPNEEFEVNVASGTHPVFIAHFVDQAFRDKKDEANYFNGLEFLKCPWTDYDWTNFNERYSIYFISKVYSWTPTTTNALQLHSDIQEDAKDILKLPNNWDRSAGGTQEGNHGFDILFGHSGEYNKVNNVLGKGMWNVGVAVWGYAILYFFGWWYFPVNIDLTTLHETGHLYYCLHIYDNYYIMADPDYEGGFKLHGDNDQRYEQNRDDYDGI